MFTGLIETVGRIRRVRHIAQGRVLEISAPDIAGDLKIGDSVAVNGVCLTVTRQSRQDFALDCLSETLKKTTSNELMPGCLVNLERAMSVEMRFDGHVVQGHVNGTGRVKKIERFGESRYIHIGLGESLLRYCIAEGSIAIQGVSLTIASVDSTGIGLNIIPHTWQNTSLKTLISGGRVNVETDVIGRYVERLLGGLGKKNRFAEIMGGVNG